MFIFFSCWQNIQKKKGFFILKTKIKDAYLSYIWENNNIKNKT